MRVYDTDGEVILESSEYNLKITSDRQLYLQKKGGKQYKSINREIREGLTSHQKKLYLIMLSEKIEKKREQTKETEQKIEGDNNEIEERTRTD